MDNKILLETIREILLEEIKIQPSIDYFLSTNSKYKDIKIKENGGTSPEEMIRFNPQVDKVRKAEGATVAGKYDSEYDLFSYGFVRIYIQNNDLSIWGDIKSIQTLKERIIKIIKTNNITNINYGLLQSFNVEKQTVKMAKMYENYENTQECVSKFTQTINKKWPTKLVSSGRALVHFMYYDLDIDEK